MSCEPKGFFASSTKCSSEELDGKRPVNPS